MRGGWGREWRRFCGWSARICRERICPLDVYDRWTRFQLEDPANDGLIRIDHLYLQEVVDSKLHQNQIRVIRYMFLYYGSA